jgi:hypothetical protein
VNLQYFKEEIFLQNPRWLPCSMRFQKQYLCSSHQQVVNFQLNLI